MSHTPASSREELERVQLAKLRKLRTAVRPANAFYEAKLGQAICKEAKGDTTAAISTYQSLPNSNDKVIQSRATALLEAAQTMLEPLVEPPKPCL